jgi:hypothetical protein
MKPRTPVRKFLELALSVSLLLGVSQTAVLADTIETLIMPGKVIKGHAKYEDDCNNCHRLFSKEDQSQLCLDCHKDIAKDVKAKKGFHGLMKIDTKTGCKTCHTEHKGRDEDIVKLDPQTFNHELTDFPLRHRHQTVVCSKCHDPKKKFAAAPSDCFSCHEKASPHGDGLGKLAKKCDSCHNEKIWTAISFDHDKTKYKLTGKHIKTQCAGCHSHDRYTKTPTDCFSCHRINDSHGGRNGKECNKCHTTASWKKLSFDHNEDTDFPLTGRHEGLACVSCHKKDPYKFEIESTCISCHKLDDVHKGSNGTKCEACHGTKTWKTVKFDHDKDTKFKLKGKHKKAACTTCHKKDPYKEKTSMECYSCHKNDDAHRGQQGKLCQNCHNEAGWREKVRFDHDLTAFPLIGLHATAACEACHLTTSYKGTTLECNACHAKDDTHKKRLGINCELCHNPNGWKVWRFDHDKQSIFKIDGEHKKLHCNACHREELKKIPHNTTRDCIACHRSDDIHNGQFGARCDRCHTTKSFKDIKLKN